MISEPEMAGDSRGAGTREDIGDFDQEFLGEQRPHRPWEWAMGGMLVASALWTAALFLYGVGDRKPDMHGYRLKQDPCPSLRLESIGAALAPREPTARTGADMLRHAALDQITCSIPLRPPAGADRSGKGWSVEYTVGITVALHKKTDPGAEFEARQRVTEVGVDPDVKLESVPGLGDVAYLLTREEGFSELRVREGGAVLSLSLSAFLQFEQHGSGVADGGDAPGVPNLSPYGAAMISDMRDVMSALRH
ncbi:hypothetical protein AB0G71_09805 [Streptomyces sp. NPDC020403]|uniref:hypothetical protein n=1 Tax=unclassified Streptomyces TaxID=2593676 RepID=UPI0033D79A52